MDAAEAGLLVQAARRVQLALRPQRELAIAGLPREADALVDQAAADTESSRVRLHEEQPQLGDGLRFTHDEDRTDDLAVPIRDPAALASRVEVIEEVRADAR